MSYEELRCDSCNAEIGFIVENGPRGLAYCTSCHTRNMVAEYEREQLEEEANKLD